MSKIRLGSDNFIQLNGPVRVDTSVASDNDGTCTARLYDERKETRTTGFITRLTSSAAAAATTLKIPKIVPAVFEISDQIYIELDDGSTDQRGIGGSVDTSNVGYDVLSLGSGITSAVSAGNAITIKSKRSGASSFSVSHSGDIKKGDQIEIFQDDGTVKVTTVAQVQVSTATEDAANVNATAAKDQLAFTVFTLDAVLTAAVSAGLRVRRKIGADVAMSNFGSFPTANPTIGDTSWGFRGTIPDTQADLSPGQDVKIEIVYNGGAGLQLVDAIRAKVVEAGT